MFSYDIQGIPVDIEADAPGTHRTVCATFEMAESIYSPTIDENGLTYAKV